MKTLLLDFAQDLNDAYPGYEFSIWTQAQLLRWFNEALCLIATQRPDMFTEQKIVKVQSCENYMDLCDCLNVLQVLGQCDAQGRQVRPISRRAAKSAGWQGIRRKQEFTDTITEYELLETGNLLRVYPNNLDPTKDLYVLLLCSVQPKTYTLDDEAPDQRCAFMAAARHYVLYSAKSMDGEFSQSYKQAAEHHQQMFASILEFTKKADENYEKRGRKQQETPRG